ncbi:MAG: glutamine amidotransferase [Verrucomicrobiota bacterium]|jgi:uncharacterized membrane protein|nr:glutamine amidotransferase [Verrucomicrobiota bacterium]
MTGTIYLSGEEWLIPAALILLVGLATVLWSYHKAPTDGRIRGACIGLKTLGLMLLLICLVDPMVSSKRAKRGANLLALVADNSEGLNITDSGARLSRAEILKQTLRTEPNNWQAKLARDFEVKRYAFDSRLNNIDDFAGLTFDGPASQLGDSLRTLTRRYRGQPLAGIVMFTDGVATDFNNNLPALTGLPRVYPVVVGEDTPKRDVALGKITPTQTAFEDAPVTITAQVNAIGCKGENITAKLESLNSRGEIGTVVKKKSLPAGETESKLTFRFQVRPAARGILFYRINVSSSAGKTEATRANNSRVVVIDRGGGPHRVLYVSGRANWEFKFLKRALDEDEQVDLIGLVRIAKKEPKFTFKSRAGEGSNPLFRGFDKDNQDTENYDKPVLIRLNTRDADELKTGFPAEAKELFEYSAVIVDDLEANFFRPSQHALLDKYVSKRGGSLLMLGGQESFRQGKYERTPIGNLLPVYFDRPTDVTALHDLRLTLTRDGWLQPWVRLRDNESDERSRLTGMTEFVSLNRVRGKKPGANVLATVHIRGDSTQHPALVTHRFGRGRVAAIMLGDIWRWGLKDAAQHEDMDKAWRQTIRWLVADVPEPTELTVGSATGANGRMLVVNAYDKEFQPIDNAQVSIKIRRIGNTNSISLRAEPVTEQAGVYRAQFIPRTNGGYLAEAEIRDESGKLLGRPQAGWATDFAAAEYRSLAPNVPLLETIANKTGGQVISLDELDKFAAQLPAQRARFMEDHHFPIWHQSIVFLLALACLISEWFIRRRKGLP